MEKNHFPEPNLAYVGFSSSESNVQGHVLNTDGDALRQLQIPAERKKN
jgi:hypothetical protein